MKIVDLRLNLKVFIANLLLQEAKMAKWHLAG
jgi:hypothetical protein